MNEMPFVITGDTLEEVRFQANELIRQLFEEQISTNSDLGNSDIIFPSQNAVKTYIDTIIAAQTVNDLGLMEKDVGGDLMPATTNQFDTTFELDENDDIQPKVYDNFELDGNDDIQPKV